MNVMTNQAAFQLTAARRRLVILTEDKCHLCCFNSQPPEGGWTA